MCLFVFHHLPLHVHNALTHKHHSIISLLIPHWELHRDNPQAVRCLWSGKGALCLDGNLFFLLCYATFHRCSYARRQSTRFSVCCLASLSICWFKLFSQTGLTAAALKHHNYFFLVKRLLLEQ